MQNALTKDVKLSPAVRAVFCPRTGFVSGSVLKLVAVVSMTIDHFAGGILYFMLLQHRVPAWTSFTRLYQIYQVMRGIGRTAFPIYCFLLIEGLMHTRSRAKYLRRLVLFALISEIPFDLAVIGELSDPASGNIPQVLWESRGAIITHQNVFFTLAIGLAAAWMIEALRARFGVCPLTVLAAVPIVLFSGLLAEYSQTDYGEIGVWLILTFYLLYPLRIAAVGVGYFILTRLYLEQWGFPGFLLALFYNGERGFLGRGRATKYFFYAFYPAHLLLFFLIRVAWLNTL